MADAGVTWPAQSEDLASCFGHLLDLTKAVLLPQRNPHALAEGFSSQQLVQQNTLGSKHVVVTEMQPAQEGFSRGSQLWQHIRTTAGQQAAAATAAEGAAAAALRVAVACHSERGLSPEVVAAFNDLMRRPMLSSSLYTVDRPHSAGAAAAGAATAAAAARGVVEVDKAASFANVAEFIQCHTVLLIDELFSDVVSGMQQILKAPPADVVSMPMLCEAVEGARIGRAILQIDCSKAGDKNSSSRSLRGGSDVDGVLDAIAKGDFGIVSVQPAKEVLAAPPGRPAAAAADSDTAAGSSRAAAAAGSAAAAASGGGGGGAAAAVNSPGADVLLSTSVPAVVISIRKSLAASAGSYTHEIELLYNSGRDTPFFDTKTNAVCHFTPVAQFITTIRELQALADLAIPRVAAHPLLKLMLQPKDRMQQVHSSKDDGQIFFGQLPMDIQGLLLQGMNESQATAVRNVCRQGGTLILEGPPGTGKTEVIARLLSASRLPFEIRLVIAGSSSSSLDHAGGSSARSGGSDAGSRAGGSSSQGTLLPSGYPVRTAVTAQSNVAVTETFLRFKNKGQLQLNADNSSMHFNTGGLKVVVLGSGVTDPSAYPYLLHTQVRAALLANLPNKNSISRQEVLDIAPADQLRQLKVLKGQLADKEQQQKLDRQQQKQHPGGPGRQRRHGRRQLLREAEMQRLQQRILAAEDAVVDKFLKARWGPLYEGQRHQASNQVLAAADFVFGTLSAFASPAMKDCRPGGAIPQFDVVCGDEAGQATQPSTAVLFLLLKVGGTLILVGDPKQLGPVVKSNKAGVASELSIPLLDRLLAAGYPSVMLDKQYRMHPAIAAFPSQMFYEGNLDNGVTAPQRFAGYHEDVVLKTQPFGIYHVRGQEQRTAEKSYINVIEATHVVLHVIALLERYPGIESIGIITPYKAQAILLIREFCKAYDVNSKDDLESMGIEVDTVDAFQGRECEVVIYSCVRCNAEGRLGFVSDERRMNVAFTRAKFAFWIFCNVPTMSSKSGPWQERINSAINLQVVWQQHNPNAAAHGGYYPANQHAAQSAEWVHWPGMP